MNFLKAAQRCIKMFCSSHATRCVVFTHSNGPKMLYDPEIPVFADAPAGSFFNAV